MERIIKRMKKNKIIFSLVSFVFILLTITNGLLIYSLTMLNGIANTLRYFGMIVIIIIWLFMLFYIIKTLLHQKMSKIITLIVALIIYSSITGYVGYNIYNAVSKFGNITSNSKNYSTSIITLRDNKNDNIKDVLSGKVGMLSDETSVDGYQIAKEIISDKNINENNVKLYDSYATLLKDLYEEKIEYAFVPTNYSVLFVSLEGFSKIEEETKIVYSKEKKVTNKTTSTKKLTEPFTILLMGVDSEYENIAGSSFNGDSLMLLTFNPDTLNTTILSIPRDTYVPIACFNGQRKNKITHAAWYGEDCMIKTIENFTNISIDYYVKINFKGLVKLVDALGGVDVDVPFSFCEQNSDRAWGDATIYVEEGLQTLNGEQALALARNRHPNPDRCSSKWTNYDSNDFVRGQNQQLIIKAMLNKLKNIRSVEKIQNLLDVISNSMETNLTTTKIFSLYDVGINVLNKSKDAPIEDLLTMQRLYISGIDAMIYDYSTYNNQGTGLTLYDFVPYKGSISDISNAMKINLGIIQEEVIKNFSFDVDESYEEKIIGKGSYKENNLTLLPSFVGGSKEKAVSFCNTYGITLNIEYIDSNDSYYSPGIIDSQSVHKGIDLDALDKSKGLTIKVVKDEVSSSGSNNSTTEEINCMDEKYKDDTKNCAIPTFKGDSVSYVKNWFSQYNKYSINVIYDGPDNVDDANTIVTDQSPYKTVYSLKNNSFKVTYEEK